jgi:hypothetical protein
MMVSAEKEGSSAVIDSSKITTTYPSEQSIVPSSISNHRFSLE